jgi:ABC-type bacteriocin/lantibiotic exporter with double-glycine peptidase domain
MRFSLGALRRQQDEIPFVQQMQWTDCGAACLAMVLARHGAPVPLAELRTEMGIGRDGMSARGILEAAARRGLAGRGVRLEVADLALLPHASILHWQFNHFIVFDGPCEGGIRVVDPAHGPRVISHAELDGAFTGVALVFEPAGPLVGSGAARPARKSGLARLFAELRSERSCFQQVIVMSVLLRFFALAVPLLTGIVVDKVVPRGDHHLLVVAGAGVVMLIAFDALASVVRAHLLLHLRTRIDTRMTVGFLDHLVALPFSFFQTRSTGDLLLRVGSNATVREILTANTLSGLLDGVFVLVYGVLIVCMSLQLGLLVVVLAGCHVAVFLVSRKGYRQLMVSDLEAQSKAQACLVQMLGGIETLKCAGAEAPALSRWCNLYIGQLNVSLQRASLGARVDAVRRAVELLAPIGVLSLGAVAVMDGQLSLGGLLAIGALTSGLFGPLSTLVASGLQLQLIGSYLDRIDDVLETPREVDSEAPAAARLEGGIQVRELAFSYSANVPPAVVDVSLDIPPGSSIAIVGPSGSGKSTLANLLVGLHRPGAGEVFFDGQPLSRLDVRTVRRQIGVVPQNPFVFGGTVRDNIALAAPDADLARVEWAARVACLHETIAAMPMGYDTVIADSGASLSGGERQRLAIARAVLGGHSILMLDEATSALDAVTENRMMNHLGQLGATRIIVAHRLSTVIDADLIVVMNRGRVVETGNHRQLLARGGLYSALVGGRRREPPPLEIAS